MSIHYFRFTLDDAAERQRSPLLESLLARADGFREISDWRADAFRILAPRMHAMPGVGAVAWAGHGPAPMADAAIFMATPVHYVAEMSNVRLPADGLPALQRREAEKLSVDFNLVWAGAGVRLVLGSHSSLFCVMDHAPAVTTRDPGDARGRHIENYLPTGEGAAKLRQLMSEIEMWLFEHEVNRDRGARAAPVVNGLWLWGGGAALKSLPHIEGWIAGNDPFFDAWAQRTDSSDAITAGAITAGGAASQRPSATASGVAVTSAQPGTVEWRDMELNWLQPSLRGLRSGRVERVDLSAGQRCFSAGAAWRWRLWRRRRPWWEWFT